MNAPQFVLWLILVLAGVCGHFFRLMTLDWHSESGRVVIASAALVIYWYAAWQMLMGRNRALWIAMLGPLVGLAAVWLIPGARVDSFQIQLGAIQLVGSALAAWIRWKDGGL